MSLFLLLNPKQYVTTPIVVDKSDVWYPDRHGWRKKRKLETKQILQELMQGKPAPIEYRTQPVKQALQDLRKVGYARIGKYHKRIIDQLLLAILLNDDE